VTLNVGPMAAISGTFRNYLIQITTNMGDTLSPKKKKKSRKRKETLNKEKITL
jgi:ApbE superfamily uncharacterized protein (UPF0280 family)